MSIFRIVGAHPRTFLGAESVGRWLSMKIRQACALGAVCLTCGSIGRPRLPATGHPPPWPRSPLPPITIPSRSIVANCVYCSWPLHPTTLHLSAPPRPFFAVGGASTIFLALYTLDLLILVPLSSLLLADDITAWSQLSLRNERILRENGKQIN